MIRKGRPLSATFNHTSAIKNNLADAFTLSRGIIRVIILLLRFVGKDTYTALKGVGVLAELGIRPYQSQGYLYLGDLYYQEGKIDDAISSWRRIVTTYPEVAYVTFRRLEKAFYEKGRFEKIIDLYNDVLERNPGDVRTLMTLAYIQRRKGNLDDAIGLCKTALEFEPESRGVKQALARLYYEKGEIELSLKTMVEAFNGFPTDDETYTCEDCGNKVNEALWRCPRCKHWETFV